MYLTSEESARIRGRIDTIEEALQGMSFLDWYQDHGAGRKFLDSDFLGDDSDTLLCFGWVLGFAAARGLTVSELVGSLTSLEWVATEHADLWHCKGRRYYCVNVGGIWLAVFESDKLSDHDTLQDAKGACEAHYFGRTDARSTDARTYPRDAVAAGLVGNPKY